MAKRLDPVHPGDILAHDFLEPMALSANRLAKHIGTGWMTPPATEVGQESKPATAG